MSGLSLACGTRELVHASISLLEKGAGHVARVLLHHLKLLDLLSLLHGDGGWRGPVHVGVHVLVVGELRAVQTVRPAMHLRLIPTDTGSTRP